MSLSNEESQMVFSTKTVIVSSEKMEYIFQSKKRNNLGLGFFGDAIQVSEVIKRYKIRNELIFE